MELQAICGKATLSEVLLASNPLGCQTLQGQANQSGLAIQSSNLRRVRVGRILANATCDGRLGEQPDEHASFDRDNYHSWFIACAHALPS